MGWVVNATLRPLYPEDRPGTYYTWMGPVAGLDRCGKSRPTPGFDPRTDPAPNELLYRLSYPGPITTAVYNISHPQASDFLVCYAV
jgi:hypothetical protein